MIRIVLLLSVFCAVLCGAVSCDGSVQSSDCLCGEMPYAVYADSVVDDTLTVKALSPTRLVVVPHNGAGDMISVDIDTLPPSVPRYESEQMLANFLYNAAVDELLSGDTVPDDYGIYLSAALLDPGTARRSLFKRIRKGDAGDYIEHGKEWPVRADGLSWAVAMWELYNVTGDVAMLRDAVVALENTLNEYKSVLWDDTYKLMHGTQASLESQAMSYPEWMIAKDRYEMMTLGANVMIAEAFRVRDSMITRLPDCNIMPMWVGLDKEISDAVNNNLWIPNLGFYSRYLYGGIYPVQSQAVDNLSQALAIIFGIANKEMARSIIAKTPCMDYGVTSEFPFVGSGVGDEDCMNPMVQACWTIAAAKTRNLKAVELGLAALFRCCVAAVMNGDDAGRSVLEQASEGMPAIVLRVLMGMDFTASGINFSPVVPAMFSGEKRLSGVRYRNADLTVTVIGTGDVISEFTVNGVANDRYFIPCDIRGKVDVVIRMDERSARRGGAVTRQYPVRMPETPVIMWDDMHEGRIGNYTGGIAYDVVVNGDLLNQVTAESVRVIPVNNYTVVDVIPVRDEMWCGFSSRPHEIVDTGAVIEIEADIRAGREWHREEFLTKGIRAGNYLLDVVYTCNRKDEGCTLYMLYIDEAEAGAVVMPHDIDIGRSNMLRVKLKSDNPHITLQASGDNKAKRESVVSINGLRLIKQ